MCFSIIVCFCWPGNAIQKLLSLTASLNVIIHPNLSSLWFVGTQGGSSSSQELVEGDWSRSFATHQQCKRHCQVQVNQEAWIKFILGTIDHGYTGARQCCNSGEKQGFKLETAPQFSCLFSSTSGISNQRGKSGCVGETARKRVATVCPASITFTIASQTTNTFLWSLPTNDAS